MGTRGRAGRWFEKPFNADSVRSLAGRLGALLLLLMPLSLAFVRMPPPAVRPEFAEEIVGDETGDEPFRPTPPEGREDREFFFAAQAILDKIGAGDLAGFKKRAAEAGVLVTKRELDWDLAYKRGRPVPGRLEPVIPKVGAGLPLEFTLAGNTAATHAEEQVFFPTEELGGAAFGRIFKQFHFLIADSRKSFPIGIETALNLNAAGFDPRFAGPAVEGKVCSNEFWRVYCVKQQGAWRVWKLELEYTH